MKQALITIFILIFLLSAAACSENEHTGESALDIDNISHALATSGHFPDTLEEWDSGEVPGQLSLYEDRIEAAPEDLADARFYIAFGNTADQFLLLVGTDSDAADRLEDALGIYAEDQRSAFEFYNAEEAYRMDHPIIERRGCVILFVVGDGSDELQSLCERLMDGEPVEISTAPNTETPDTTGQTTSDNEGISESTTLSAEDISSAQDAALAYYKNTVFEIHELTLSEFTENSIKFTVACSKGGERCDPDRSITLERTDDVWNVMSEGY